MIVLDGTYGEGGGQIVRTALTLSILTRQPMQIEGVRANRRPKPGLQPQHLSAVKAAANLCQAKLQGAALGSSRIQFEPGDFQDHDLDIAIGTAGGTSLVLHTVYLPLLLLAQQPRQVRITGGTHQILAPFPEHLQRTWAKWLQRMGLSISIECTKPGFYPRGGGEIQAQTVPCSSIEPIQATDPFELQRIRIESVVANLPAFILEKINQRLKQRWRKQPWEIDFESLHWQNGPAALSIATVEHDYVPACFIELGAKDISSDQLADRLAVQVEEYVQSQAIIDSHMADQLLLPLSFARGESAFRTNRITQHLLTNMHTIEQFGVANFAVTGTLDSPGMITITPRHPDGFAGAS